MSFNFFSLDYIYYPVSGIMWVWHKIFGSFLGASNPWSWVLSIVFLVFTLRGLLFRLFMKQMDSQLKMQAVQPEMKKLREKYKDDRQRLTEEMMRLNKEAGVNPLGGCLPAVVQSIVFIGLFHVLRSFRPYQDAQGVFHYRDNVYFFGPSEIHSFSEARLFGGAPLSAFMTMPQAELEFMHAVRATVVWVGVPLTILAGIATHLTSRRSVARQATMGVSVTGQTAIMNKLMMYGFPLFVVIGGPFFPLAILFYWLSNNSWTFGQLWVAHRIQDRKKAVEAQVVEAAKVETTYSKPLPGARPQDPKRKVVQPSPIRPNSGGSNGPGGSGTSGSAGPAGPDAKPDAKADAGKDAGKDAGPAGTTTGTGGSGSGGNGSAGAAGPKPGAKPSGNPRKKKPGKR